MKKYLEHQKVGRVTPCAPFFNHKSGVHGVTRPTFWFGKQTVFVIAATLICLTGCKPSDSAETVVTPKPSEPVNVKLVQPRKGDVNRIVTLPASVIANQQVTLYSKVTGYLKTIAVDKGDEVKKGDLLAEIEAPELLADLARFKAEAEIAELDYKRASDAQKKAPA